MWDMQAQGRPKYAFIAVMPILQVHAALSLLAKAKIVSTDEVSRHFDKYMSDRSLTCLSSFYSCEGP